MFLQQQRMKMFAFALDGGIGVVYGFVLTLITPLAISSSALQGFAIQDTPQESKMQKWEDGEISKEANLFFQTVGSDLW